MNLENTIKYCELKKINSQISELEEEIEEKLEVKSNSIERELLIKDENKPFAGIDSVGYDSDHFLFHLKTQ